METLHPAKPIHGSTFRRAVLLVAALVVTAAMTAGPTRATPPSGMTTEFLLSPLAGGKATFDEIDIFAKTDRNPGTPTDFWKAQIGTKGASDLYVVRNTFAPGGTSGWHTHPGPSLVTVTQGTITVYDGDDPTCTPRVLSAGSTFVDPTSNNHLHLVRNEIGTPAVTVAVQLVPAGFPRRVDKDNPGFCRSIN
jgi:quercetin dioxygenase-like cupin family protein